MFLTFILASTDEAPAPQAPTTIKHQQQTPTSESSNPTTPTAQHEAPKFDKSTMKQKQQLTPERIIVGAIVAYSLLALYPWLEHAFA